jgi:hypothetical protein
MNWLPLDQLRALIPLPPGLRVESMHSAHIAAVIAALRSWYPDVAYGSNSGYLRDEFYRQRVCLDGADDKACGRPSERSIHRPSTPTSARSRRSTPAPD